MVSKDILNEFFHNLYSANSRDIMSLRRVRAFNLEEDDAKAVEAFYDVVPDDVPPDEYDDWFAIASWFVKQKAYADRPKKTIQEAITDMLKDKDKTEKELIINRVVGFLEAQNNGAEMRLSKLDKLLNMIWQRTDDQVDLRDLLKSLLGWTEYDNTSAIDWAEKIFRHKPYSKVAAQEG